MTEESKTITFEDFMKLDIRIGEIVKAEKVEGADKLVRLEVNLGHELRQLVAGIAQFCTTEQLIGKQIPVLVNLEPRRLHGVESQGMILAVAVEGKSILLHPGEEVLNGSRLR